MEFKSEWQKKFRYPVRGRLWLQWIFLVVVTCLMGCHRSYEEVNLYAYFIETIYEHRSEPLDPSGDPPVMTNGWHFQKDEEGVVIDVDDPAKFSEIDQFFRGILGNPHRVWEDGNWVVYFARKTGVMVSYEKYEDPDGGVKIIILRPQ